MLFGLEVDRRGPRSSGRLPCPRCRALRPARCHPPFSGSGCAATSDIQVPLLPAPHGRLDRAPLLSHHKFGGPLRDTFRQWTVVSSRLAALRQSNVLPLLQAVDWVPLPPPLQPESASTVLHFCLQPFVCTLLVFITGVLFKCCSGFFGQDCVGLFIRTTRASRKCGRLAR
ncbi:hypothetical protein NDU88_002595 [Pleurodeles waltl]|uniref:Uncharacterized protein n=1 Tax=Pleurodeles waltl TaxID=8319 RepID=A0AAV7M1Z1_PLEWA|nr:hypothetical protein NDU88_002595 [Pleurodeles waltl]